ncbi:hypothetical protein Daus18300_008721 [Diaporthe australafricana]|uniref:SUR7 protein n=1 Tax=Diaporthe australafricana TaxID=127596 RepID=A0ABR3WH65_9PEZI
MTLLCLFAGSRTSFLPEFSLITVNTSQVGQGILNSTYVDSHPELATILDSIPDFLQGDAEDLLNTVIQRLGIHDFYTANLMTYCQGYYEPTAIPNETVSSSDITRNFTYCSPPSGNFQFDPREALQRDLNASGNGWLNVSDLNWPDEIDRGIDAIHIVQRVAFIICVYTPASCAQSQALSHLGFQEIYPSITSTGPLTYHTDCVSIGLIGLATLVSIVSFFFSGRLSACGNIVLALLAFLVVGVASALATAIAVVGSRAVDQYAEQVGITASAGRRFLGLTWGATAAMLVCLIWWSVDCCIGRRGRRRGFSRSEKYTSWDK